MAANSFHPISHIIIFAAIREIFVYAYNRRRLEPLFLHTERENMCKKFGIQNVLFQNLIAYFFIPF